MCACLCVYTFGEGFLFSPRCAGWSSETGTSLKQCILAFPAGVNLLSGVKAIRLNIQFSTYRKWQFHMVPLILGDPIEVAIYSKQLLH